MRKIITTLVFLLLVPATVLHAQNNPQITESPCHEHCGHLLNDQQFFDCVDRWEAAHSYHETLAGGGCSNWSPSTGPASGTCGMTWINGSHGLLTCSRFDTGGGECTITGGIKCGGVVKDFQLTCNGGNPSATVRRDSSECNGYDGGSSVSCNSVSGDLMYGFWGRQN